MERAANSSPEWERARLAAARVADGLERLERLGADRTDAWRVVEGIGEEIEVAVEHLRVDGASWAQIGRSLGTSRQGARQCFGSVGTAQGIGEDPPYATLPGR